MSYIFILKLCVGQGFRTEIARIIIGGAMLPCNRGLNLVEPDLYDLFRCLPGLLKPL